MKPTATLAGYDKTMELLTAVGGSKARRGMRQAMNRGLTVIVRGIKGKVGTRARTRGHSLTRIRRAVGRRVKAGQTPNMMQGKVGYGVGKRRGSYPPHGLFKFWGTKDRYTGAVTKRARFFGVKSKYSKATGKARRFRGKVPEGTFVQEGFNASSASAAKVMEDVAAAVLLRETIPSPESDFDLTD